MQNENFLPELPRKQKINSITNSLNFVRDAFEELITKRAFVYTVQETQGARSISNGIMVLDDDQLGQFQKSRANDGNLFHNFHIVNLEQHNI